MPHKLLLADDSVTIQRVIELTFADEDVKVTAVGNGQLAIDQIAAEPPDIVLADVGMPERDGYEVAAFVKDRPELAHIPVLLLTGAFEPVDEKRAREVRCDGVLAKPFEPQLLITRVKDLLAAGHPGHARAEVPEPESTAADDDTGPVPLPPGPVEEDATLDARQMLEDAPASQDVEMSLDDYFDRLDQAFANLAGSNATRPAVRAPETSWAPPPAEADAIPVTEAPARAAEVPVGPGAGATPPASVPMADVFAALLEAESSGTAAGGADAPAPVLMLPTTALPDELVEEVTRRVVERMADRALRETVADIVAATAERLVREEIARLKAAAR